MPRKGRADVPSGSTASTEEPPATERRLAWILVREGSSAGQASMSGSQLTAS